METDLNISFVATKVCLLRQNFCVFCVCRNKHNFVMTMFFSWQAYFCHNKRRTKHVFAATELFVTTKMILVAVPTNDTRDQRHIACLTWEFVDLPREYVCLVTKTDGMPYHITVVISSGHRELKHWIKQHHHCPAVNCQSLDLSNVLTAIGNSNK